MKMKKSVSILLVILLLLAVSVLAVACTDNGKVTMKFVAEGIRIDDVVGKPGSTYTKPVPTREGNYAFVGWYLNSDFSGEPVELPDTIPNKDVTYYGKWEQNAFKVTLDANGGSVSTAEVTVAAGASIMGAIENVLPTKGALHFGGWRMNGAMLTQNTVMPNEDVTLTAVWEAEYTAHIYKQKLNGKDVVEDEFDMEDATGYAEVGKSFTYTAIPTGFSPLLPEHAGQVKTITIGESGNEISAYFIRNWYEVTFDNGANDATGEIEGYSLPHGATIDKPDSSVLSRPGYMFGDWTWFNDQSDQEVLLLPREIDRDYEIVACWDQGVSNRDNPSDIIYIHTMGVFGSKGSVYRVKEGEKVPGYLGYDQIAGLYLTFNFYNDDSFAPSGDDYLNAMEATETGRIYPAAEEGQMYFIYKGEEEGLYIYKDYRYINVFYESLLYLDGFGLCQTAEMKGGQIYFGTAYGKYEYDEDHGDYTYIEIDVATQKPTENGFHFALLEGIYPDNITGEAKASYKGSYNKQGGESGSYLEYDMQGSEIYQDVFQLNGYGVARMITYDPNADDGVGEIIEGYYTAEDSEHINLYGEWLFVPEDGTSESFHFMLTYTTTEQGEVMLFIRENEGLEGKLIGENGASLELGGYNAAIYRDASGDEELEGLYYLTGEEYTNLFFTFYESDGNDGYRVGGQMVFTIVWGATGDGIGSFAVNVSGLDIQNGVLKGVIRDESGQPMYNSVVFTVPENVTEIDDDAMNYVRTDVNLRSVVIHENVTRIGARAFENNHTMVQATFKAANPIDIDWTDANNPFRWPKSNFVIIVPDSALTAYREAWTDCPYEITTLTELANKPEWVIEGNVLTKYNPKSDVTDILIPDEVTEIGAQVFSGMDITSVDLNNVTKVGYRAFGNCIALEEIIATNLTTIDMEAFYACYALTEIELPSIVDIGEAAFAGCLKLVKITFGPNIAQLGQEAFYECGSDDSTGTTVTVMFIFDDNTTIPVLGKDAFTGIESYRNSVKDVQIGRSFYAAPTWGKFFRPYVRTLLDNELANFKWIEIGEPTINYFYGRAELMGLSVGLYEFTDDTHIVFYVYDSTTNTESIVNATLEDGVLSMNLDGVDRKLVKMNGWVTYTAADKSTLQVNYNFDDMVITNESSFIVDVKFMPKGYEAPVDGKLSVIGRKYTMRLGTANVTFTFAVDKSFTYDASLDYKSDTYNHADDGESYLQFWFTGSHIYVNGHLKDWPNITVESWMTWEVTQHEGDLYVIKYNYQSTTYFIYVTVDESAKTFTYTKEQNAYSTAFKDKNGIGSVVITRDKYYNVKDAKLLLVLAEGELATQVTATFEFDATRNGANDTFNSDGEFYLTFTVDDPSAPENMQGRYQVTLREVKDPLSGAITGYESEIVKLAD